jgi:hypothetical protein
VERKHTVVVAGTDAAFVVLGVIVIALLLSWT